MLRFLPFALSPLLLLVPSRACAEPNPALPNMSGALSCDDSRPARPVCDPAPGATTCPSGQSCVTAEGNGLLSYCTDNPVFCCNSPVDCPTTVNGLPTTFNCMALAGINVCVPIAAPSPCMANASEIGKCHVQADGAFWGPVDTGDCDSDGVLNAMDACPCDHFSTVNGCEAVDASVADAGPPDVGVPDAAPPDTGAPPVDSGTTGTPDTSATVSFEGGGGCACRAAPERPARAPLALGASLIGLVLLLRRR